MPVLDRKLVRDLKASAGSLAAVLVIIALGTGVLIGLRSAQRVLESSQAGYYRDYHFADFWIDVKKAPLPAVERLGELPGIARLEDRIVFDVLLDLDGVIQPVRGRLISIPEGKTADVINGIHLRHGSTFSPDRDEEVIIGDAFARAHNLHPGDRIRLILNRKRQSFVIVGTAISPEYVYMVRGEGDFVPDPRGFGILYVKQHYAREVLDFQDACNQIVGRLQPGDEDDVDYLLQDMKRRLEPYGVLATVPRKRQASHRFLADEINGLRNSATIMPIMFLLVAALVLNVLMTRTAERQRSVIGTLKAMGYGHRQIMWHFVSFGLVVGVLGGVAGVGIGVVLTWAMISKMYPLFFEFPAFHLELFPDLFAVGMLFSLVFAAAGTIKGARKMLQLEPAEAMRPKPPARGGSVFLERLSWFWQRLGFRTHIALRSLIRNRGRTITSVLATGISTCMIFGTLVMYHSLFFLIDFQFERVLRSDVDIGMRDEESASVIYETQALPGVERVEPILSVACELRCGPRSRRVGITGLSADHTLTVPMKSDFTPITIPRQGLVLSKKLAEVLHAQRGDRLALTPIRGRRETVDVRVADTVDTFMGLDAYADLRYLAGIVGESYAVNALQLKIEPDYMPAFFRAIKQMPNAQGVSIRADARKNIEATMTETMGASFLVLILFAGAIAFGAIINNALSDIADQKRDVATFRVLGYTPAQVAGIYFRQNLAVFAVGIVLSFPLGYLLVWASMQAYNTELFRMPIVIRWPTVAMTVGLSLIFVLAAQLFIHRHIAKLNWLDAVQTKE